MRVTVIVSLPQGICSRLYNVLSVFRFQGMGWVLLTEHRRRGPLGDEGATGTDTPSVSAPWA